MLYEVRNKKGLSLRLKVSVLLVWRPISGRVFQALGLLFWRLARRT